MPIPRFCACGSIIARHSSMTSTSDTGSRDSVHLARLDQREIEHFVDQLEQIPSCLEDLVEVSLLGGCRRRRAGFEQLGEPEDRVERRAQFVAHAGEKIRFRAIGLFRCGHGLLELGFRYLARGIVGADQQVSDNVAVVVAQRGDRHDGGKAAPILTDVREVVDVLDPARSLERQRLETRCNGRGELGAQRQGARLDLLSIVNIARAYPVHDLRRRIPQHSFGADIEELDDAFLVGGDDREIGAGQNGVLQGARFQQRDLAPHFGAAVGIAARVTDQSGKF